jgi:hypothetical protein
VPQRHLRNRFYWLFIVFKKKVTNQPLPRFYEGPSELPPVPPEPDDDEDDEDDDSSNSNDDGEEDEEQAGEEVSSTGDGAEGGRRGAVGLPLRLDDITDDGNKGDDDDDK